MTAPHEDSDTPLPEVVLPAETDHPVLAAILADLRERTAARDRHDPPPVVARYEDAP